MQPAVLAVVGCPRALLGLGFSLIPGTTCAQRALEGIEDARNVIDELHTRQ